MNLCKHGFPLRWKNQTVCGYPDRPNGATVTDLHELDRFQVIGRGPVLLVEKLDNERGIIGRTVSIDGISWEVMSYESCLIPGHDTSHCFCFKATALLVRPVKETEPES